MTVTTNIPLDSPCTCATVRCKAVRRCAAIEPNRFALPITRQSTGRFGSIHFLLCVARCIVVATTCCDGTHRPFRAIGDDLRDPAAHIAQRRHPAEHHANGRKRRRHVGDRTALSLRRRRVRRRLRHRWPEATACTPLCLAMCAAGTCGAGVCRAWADVHRTPQHTFGSSHHSVSTHAGDSHSHVVNMRACVRCGGALSTNYSVYIVFHGLVGAGHCGAEEARRQAAA